MNKKVDIRLLDLIDVNIKTKMLVVLIGTEIPVWFWKKTVYKKHWFTYYDGIWIGEDNLVVTDNNLALALQGQLIAYVANQQVSKYVTL